MDSDYSRRGRDVVMTTLYDGYGRERVCKIGTYSRLKIKSAIKDLARTMGYGILDNDGNIVQYEPFILNRILDLHVTATSRGEVELAELRTYQQFEEFYQKHSNWFTKYVMPLLEVIKSESIHAAGVVITQEEFIKLLPLNFRNDEEGQTTQWEMDDLDAAGYLKYDMLVIDALDVISDAKELIKKRHGVELPAIDEISTEDELTLQLFENVFTRGIFQYNTFSQMNFFYLLKPKSFDDLVASVALIRPGPMAADAHNLYAAIANGLADARYLLDDLKSILGNTHGLLVYQEQMMRAAVAIADFTGEESEALRKACGKKKIEEMRKWESEFVNRAVKKGHDQKAVEQLWSQIVEFAEYSFNLSHSVCYSLISFYQGYIKARYKTEYWCAVLSRAKKTSATGNSVYDLKAEAEREGIRFIFPSADGFASEFAIKDHLQIYWPLSVIKGVGDKALEHLTDNDNRFHFEDMEHFTKVVLLKKQSTDKNGKKTQRQIVTSAVVKALVKAGFFNCWMKPQQAMESFNTIYANLSGKKKEELDYEMANDDPFYWVNLRNEIFGCQVSSWKQSFPFDKDCHSYYSDELRDMPDGTRLLIGGQVTDMIFKRTKQGRSYAQFQIVDGAERYSIKAWSDYWEDENLDKTRTRPRNGDLLEILVEKKSWNNRPEFHVGRKGQYSRIVGRK